MGVSDREFKVDLQELADAAAGVRRHASRIDEALDGISRTFTSINTAWVSPAADTLTPVETWFTNVARDLRDLLDEMVRRMHTAHANYSTAEEHNHRSLMTHQDRVGSHHGGSRQGRSHHGVPRREAVAGHDDHRLRPATERVSPGSGPAPAATEPSAPKAALLPDA
ncbi:WXG100 family type VII secretion target [Streptacidiphilus sp. ASG 303]|uniref:WXG100 family type VII secretion target n=1 Tax=Streptacidiphilus sp. ASG 303 TaxID=2896847 RepID=UPI001E47721A|nr:WXG100 family type VII secretion target [Streptacidiphilus sp. ASG 303]MCD0484787.1 WXG100 family type VII secretion target [Streptacidiphilus sp. ASG 303]